MHGHAKKNPGTGCEFGGVSWRTPSGALSRNGTDFRISITQRDDEVIFKDQGFSFAMHYFAGGIAMLVVASYMFYSNGFILNQSIAIVVAVAVSLLFGGLYKYYCFTEIEFSKNSLVVRYRKPGGTIVSNPVSFSSADYATASLHYYIGRQIVKRYGAVFRVDGYVETILCSFKDKEKVVEWLSENASILACVELHDNDIVYHASTYTIP